LILKGLSKKTRLFRLKNLLSRPHYSDQQKLPTPRTPRIDRAFMGRSGAKNQEKITGMGVFSLFVGENT
jgi:hypothetical protein